MRRPIEPWLVGGILAVLVIWGIALRLVDPLSTRALGAEDPYTHIVFTKEWIDEGAFGDSFHLGTKMYPPGMHAFLAAFVPFTGISLYQFARVMPAFIGGLAILGMYALGSRVAGRAAGLGAAFATAIMPEHIFRTELLFPTAFDLALLPLWLLAFHMMLEGERAGAYLFAGAAIPLAIMHPWVVPLFAAPLALYAALRTLRAHASFKASLLALRLPAALLVGVVAFAMASRWTQSDTSFSDFFARAPGMSALAALPGPIVFFALLAVLGAVALALLVPLALVAAWRAPRIVRVAVSLAAGAALLAAVVPLTRELPPAVSYRVMMGPIALALAFAGFALAFLRPTALGDLAACVAIVLFPLTAMNFFGGEFWPQRTVAYLAVGIALLAANVVAHAYELPLKAARSDRARRVAGPAVIAALALVCAGAATAMPVNTYEWYRLYNDDQFHGFERVAVTLEESGDGAKVFTYTWQPALMVKALAEPENVWYSPAFFSDGAKREQQLDDATGATYVLVDDFTREAEDEGKADLGFLHDTGRYRLLFDDGVRLYEVRR